MREFVALVTIPAENEEDFKEQLDALDSYELEWWKEVGSSERRFDWKKRPSMIRSFQKK